MGHLVCRPSQGPNAVVQVSSNNLIFGAKFKFSRAQSAPTDRFPDPMSLVKEVHLLTPPFVFTLQEVQPDGRPSPDSLPRCPDFLERAAIF